MMKLAKLLPLLFLIASLSMVNTSEAQAQDMKIGFVEPQAVLDRMPEVRAVQQRLQNFVERKQNELATKERELQSELEMYQQRAGVISESARETQEQRLGQMQTELQQLQRTAPREIENRQNELMSPILNQLRSAIDTVASRKGLDYVLNRTTSTGDVIILYMSEQMERENDITDAVMEELGI